MSEIKQRYTAGLDTIKTLTGLSQQDFDTLKVAAPQATQWVDEIVQVFYDTLFAHARTAAVFHAEERPDREKTLHEWYLSLFTARDSEEFWNKQGRIGFAHIRRHINNEFMIGMASRVSDLFTQKAVMAFGVEQGLPIAQSFNRILKAVVGLTAENYDVMSQMAFSESTGAEPQLIDRLIQKSVKDVEKELFQS